MPAISEPPPATLSKPPASGSTAGRRCGTEPRPIVAWWSVAGLGVGAGDPVPLLQRGAPPAPFRPEPLVAGQRDAAVAPQQALPGIIVLGRPREQPGDDAGADVARRVEPHAEPGADVACVHQGLVAAHRQEAG